ncbi:Uncharacterized protein QTN25_005312 [Entamoeba marina]
MFSATTLSLFLFFTLNSLAQISLKTSDLTVAYEYSCSLTSCDIADGYDSSCTPDSTYALVIPSYCSEVIISEPLEINQFLYYGSNDVILNISSTLIIQFIDNTFFSSIVGDSDFDINVGESSFMTTIGYTGNIYCDYHVRIFRPLTIEYFSLDFDGFTVPDERFLFEIGGKQLQLSPTSNVALYYDSHALFYGSNLNPTDDYVCEFNPTSSIIAQDSFSYVFCPNDQTNLNFKDVSFNTETIIFDMDITCQNIYLNSKTENISFGNYFLNASYVEATDCDFELSATNITLSQFETYNVSITTNTITTLKNVNAYNVSIVSPTQITLENTNCDILNVDTNILELISLGSNIKVNNGGIVQTSIMSLIDVSSISFKINTNTLEIDCETTISVNANSMTVGNIEILSETASEPVFSFRNYGSSPFSLVDNGDIIDGKISTLLISNKPIEYTGSLFESSCSSRIIALTSTDCINFGSPFDFTQDIVCKIYELSNIFADISYYNNGYFLMCPCGNDNSNCRYDFSSINTFKNRTFSPSNSYNNIHTLVFGEDSINVDISNMPSLTILRGLTSSSVTIINIDNVDVSSQMIQFGTGTFYIHTTIQIGTPLADSVSLIFYAENIVVSNGTYDSLTFYKNASIATVSDLNTNELVLYSPILVGSQDTVVTVTVGTVFIFDIEERGISLERGVLFNITNGYYINMYYNPYPLFSGYSTHFLLETASNTLKYACDNNCLYISSSDEFSGNCIHYAPVCDFDPTSDSTDVQIKDSYSTLSPLCPQVAMTLVVDGKDYLSNIYNNISQLILTSGGDSLTLNFNDDSSDGYIGIIDIQSTSLIVENNLPIVCENITCGDFNGFITVSDYAVIDGELSISSTTTITHGTINTLTIMSGGVFITEDVQCGTININSYPEEYVMTSYNPITSIINVADGLGDYLLECDDTVLIENQGSSINRPDCPMTPCYFNVESGSITETTISSRPQCNLNACEYCEYYINGIFEIDTTSVNKGLYLENETEITLNCTSPSLYIETNGIATIHTGTVYSKEETTLSISQNGDLYLYGDIITDLTCQTGIVYVKGNIEINSCNENCVFVVDATATLRIGDISSTTISLLGNLILDYDTLISLTVNIETASITTSGKLSLNSLEILSQTELQTCFLLYNSSTDITGFVDQFDSLLLYGGTSSCKDNEAWVCPQDLTEYYCPTDAVELNIDGTVSCSATTVEIFERTCIVNVTGESATIQGRITSIIYASDFILTGDNLEVTHQLVDKPLTIENVDYLYAFVKANLSLISSNNIHLSSTYADSTIVDTEIFLNLEKTNMTTSNLINCTISSTEENIYLFKGVFDNVSFKNYELVVVGDVEINNIALLDHFIYVSSGQFSITEPIVGSVSECTIVCQAKYPESISFIEQENAYLRYSSTHIIVCPDSEIPPIRYDCIPTISQTIDYETVEYPTTLCPCENDDCYMIYSSSTIESVVSVTGYISVFEGGKNLSYVQGSSVSISNLTLNECEIELTGEISNLSIQNGIIKSDNLKIGFVETNSLQMDGSVFVGDWQITFPLTVSGTLHLNGSVELNSSGSLDITNGVVKYEPMSRILFYGGDLIVGPNVASIQADENNLIIQVNKKGATDTEYKAYFVCGNYIAIATEEPTSCPGDESDDNKGALLYVILGIILLLILTICIVVLVVVIIVKRKREHTKVERREARKIKKQEKMEILLNEKKAAHEERLKQTQIKDEIDMNDDLNDIPTVVDFDMIQNIDDEIPKDNSDASSQCASPPLNQNELSNSKNDSKSSSISSNSSDDNSKNSQRVYTKNSTSDEASNLQSNSIKQEDVVKEKEESTSDSEDL